MRGAPMLRLSRLLSPTLLVLLTLALARAAPTVSARPATGLAAQLSADDYYHRGQARADRHDYRGAFDDYSRALELQPKLVDAWIDRAISRFWLDDYAAMRADLDQALILAPASAEAIYWRGVAFARLRDDASAVPDYTEGAAAQSAPHSGASGACQRWRPPRRRDRVYRRLHRVPAGRPERQRSILWPRRPLPRAALLAFGQTPDDEDGVRVDREFMVALVGRGPMLLRSGDFAGAVQDLTAAERLGVTDASIHYTRGVARYYQGDLTGALADLDVALQRSADYPLTYTNRGVSGTRLATARARCATSTNRCS